ncbi:MAG: IMP dehydrogenase [Planctomycetota bacterium]
MSEFLGEALTFDDIVLEPGYTEVLPKDIDISVNLTRNLNLKIPILSAAMDTVTESQVAIAMAQEGGLGIIHRNMSIEKQTREVIKVKRSANGIILDPVTLPPEAKVKDAKKIMKEHNISGIPITQPDKTLVGILTRRDLRFHKDEEAYIKDIMTKNRLVTAHLGITLEEAKDILDREKVEKLLLVDEYYKLVGLVTIKDIQKMIEFPNATRDELGRFCVGAAIGAYDFERADELIKAGVDILVLDLATAHCKDAEETLRELKRNFNTEIIAGNVTTAEATEFLIKNGADVVKVGLGAGSICTTRVISGVGIPQITAIVNASKIAEKYEVKIISDGGIRYSGDITKALALGAHSVMIGSLFAGVNESPGEIVYYQGKPYKSYRGMGSIGAIQQGGSSRYLKFDDKIGIVPEGVEGLVPLQGPLSDCIKQLVGGLKIGMGYIGCRNIKELQMKARYYKITLAGIKESHSHNVIITKEAPNYKGEQI